MYRILLFLLVLPIALGCSKRTEHGNAEQNCSYQQDLTPINLNLDSGAIYLFGETHGTSEAPAFVANFACRIARDTGEPTIVLLELVIPEILSDLSGESLSVAEAQKLILEEDNHWFDGHDGRTSEAMMIAILEILQFREQGLNIALGSVYPSAETRSKYEAFILESTDETDIDNWYFKEAFQIKSYKNDFKNIITLSGKVHTRNHLQFFDKIDLDETYMGFTFVSGGGTEWNCRPNSGGCKIHKTKTYRRNLVDLSDNASLVLLTGNNEAFDGAFVFKSSNASLPYLGKDAGHQK